MMTIPTLIENLLATKSVNVKRGALTTTTLIPPPKPKVSARGVMPESWCCIDCGVNTAPGLWARAEIDAVFAAGLDGIDQLYDCNTEVYQVRESVWKQTGLVGYGGCLCIGCLEKRIGRRLKPKDFDHKHPFNSLPGTPRLLKRRGPWPRQETGAPSAIRTCLRTRQP